MAGYDYSPEENEALLKAWNNWKDLCCIRGLGENIEGRVIGTRHEQEMLANLVKSAFKRKLYPYSAQLGNGKSSYGDEFDDLDTALEFDAALREYKGATRYKRGHQGEKGFERKKKAWKDLVWQAIVQSSDSPLQVIHGKLLGSRGVISQVAEEWLMKTYSCRLIKDRKTGKKVLYFHRSNDGKDDERTADIPDMTSSPAEKDAERSWEEGRLEAESLAREDGEAQDAGFADSGEGNEWTANDKPDEVLDGLPKAWQDELERALSPRLRCVLYASVNRFKFEGETEILKALGITSESSARKDYYERIPATLKKLSAEFRENIGLDTPVLRGVMAWLKNKIKLEKAGRLILSRMEASKTDA